VVHAVDVDGVALKTRQAPETFSQLPKRVLITALKNALAYYNGGCNRTTTFDFTASCKAALQ
jgi:hypothetical protein